MLSTRFHKYTNVFDALENSLTYAILGRGVFLVPRQSPFPIELSPSEELELSRRSGKYTLPYFEVLRAKMILLASQGLSNDQIALRLDTRREVVSMWRKRFFKDRLAGLEERSRPGRPRVFPPRTGRSG